MVSNKKYRYALERWNIWEDIATDAVKKNGILLKEMKEINDLSMRVNEHNGSLIAECRKLREQLAERDSLLANVEVNIAKKIFSDIDTFTYKYMNDEDYSMDDMIYDIDSIPSIAFCFPGKSAKTVSPATEI